MPGNGRFFLRNDPELRAMFDIAGQGFGFYYPGLPLRADGGRKWDVFLSYTRRDLRLAQGLARRLSVEGKSVYFDDWDEAVDGDSPDLVDYIRGELEQSESLAVLVTENAELSWWVPLEVGISMQAKGSREHVVAYRRGAVMLPSYFKKVKTLPDAL